MVSLEILGVSTYAGMFLQIFAHHLEAQHRSSIVCEARGRPHKVGAALYGNKSLLASRKVKRSVSVRVVVGDEVSHS